MTMFPHLLEARIREAQEREKERRSDDRDDDSVSGPTALPFEIMLMQKIETVKEQRRRTDDPDRRQELSAELADLRRRLAMCHEKAGRYISARRVADD